LNLNISTRSFRASVVVASLGLAAGVAFAADPPAADSGLDTVVITSVRQAYRGDVPLNDLPQNVTVLSEEVLKQVNATQLDTVLDLSASVSRQNTFGGLWDSFAIRGFAGDENTPSGYLVNGFSGGRGFSGRRDTSNISSIEVLKGPGSALYGRGEPGGTINIVTKKPSFDRVNSVELSAGSFSTYRVAGDFTGPIGQNVAFRLNGSYTDAKSFRDTVTSKKSSLTPSLFWRIGDSTAVNYEFELVNQQAPFERGIVAVNGVLGAVPRERFLGEPADGDSKINGTGHQLTLDHRFSSNWALLAGVNFRKSSFKGYSSDPELLNGRQLLFVTPTGSLLTRQRRYRDFRADDESLRAELSGKFSTGALTNHILIGADAYDYKLDTLQLRYRPTLAGAPLYAVNIYNPVYGAVPFSALVPFGVLNDQTEKQKAYGVYVQDQIDLTEQWKALIGVRYDHFTQDFSFRTTALPVSQSGSKTSPRVGLVYAFNEQNSIYASFSRGYRPNTGTDAAQRPFSAETSESVEVGAKFATADSGVSGTVAVYRGKKSNFLTSDPVNAGFSIAGGEAQSDGLELDLVAKLGEDTQGTFSYAYTKARTTKATLDFNFGFPIPAGADLINIPLHSLHALLTHDVHLQNGGMLTLGGDAAYVSDRLGETGFAPEFRLPSYTLLNLMAAYEPNDRVKLTAYVSNLFDKVYYPSSYSRFWVAPGAPRSFTLAGSFKF
jgi:iron complex outermembrane receptor protein